MKKYIVLYRSNPSTASLPKPSAVQQKGMVDAWTSWAGRCGKSLLDIGTPLNSVALLKSPAASHVSGYSILQAETTGHVQKLLEGHPHLSTPGSSIEVLEQLPMPT
jgi:hypothetical protein